MNVQTNFWTPILTLVQISADLTKRTIFFWKIELFKVCECWVNWDKNFLTIWPKMHKPQRRSSYQAKIPNLNLAGIRWNIRSLTAEYTSEKCFSSLFSILNILTSIWSSHVNSWLQRWRMVFVCEKQLCATCDRVYINNIKIIIHWTIILNFQLPY